MRIPGSSGIATTALAAIRRRERDAPGCGDLTILADAIEAVLGIHHPSRLTVGGYVCGKCLDAYPCTTVQALERHLRKVDG